MLLYGEHIYWIVVIISNKFGIKTFKKFGFGLLLE